MNENKLRVSHWARNLSIRTIIFYSIHPGFHGRFIRHIASQEVSAIQEEGLPSQEEGVPSLE